MDDVRLDEPRVAEVGEDAGPRVGEGAARGRLAEDAYDRVAAELRHQRRWRETEPFRAEVDPAREKFSLFVAGPYASGNLHLGHVRSYTLADVCARYQRARGRNVMYTMGFDTFGLPGEVAARARGVQPAVWSERCVAEMHDQLDRLGLSLDWRRSFSTSEDRICRRTQLVFLTLYRAGLAYRGDAPVNWCDTCDTTLAGHQAEGGSCWRCGNRVRLRWLPQWFYRMTALAPELSDRLEASGWDHHLKGALRAWYGRQDGRLVRVEVPALGRTLDCFLPEPVAGLPMSFVAVRPDHPVVADVIARSDAVRDRDHLLDLLAEGADRRSGPNGWATGLDAVDPRDGRAVPVYVVDFLEGGRDLPAIAGVPAADPLQRAFAAARGLAEPAPDEALAKAAAELPETTVYRIGDWLVSRQRFWGAPVPMVHCDGCGWTPVPDAELPVRLPAEVDLSAPGNPLADPSFRDTTCPSCGGPARRETDTLDCMCELIWHYAAAASPESDGVFEREDLEYWLPIDQSFYGADVVRFTLNFEFLLAALAGLGMTSVRYPFGEIVLHGLVLNESGRKMSKSEGTAVDVGNLLDDPGADALRLYVVGAARADRPFRWSEPGLRRAARTVNRVYRAAVAAARLLEAGPVEGAGRSGPPPIARWNKRIRQCIERATTAMEQRQYHRAILDAGVLLDHLEDGLERAAKGHEDPASLVHVAALLATVLAPVTPHVAAEVATLPAYAGYADRMAAWPVLDEWRLAPTG